MPVTLENEAFRFRMLPEHGGKVDEVFHHRLRRNLLLPLAENADLPLPDGAVFSINGWDECLPTVEASAGVPDLGYAWRTTPETSIQGNSLLAHWAVPGWHMARTVHLRDDGLSAQYEITNMATSPSPLLWAAHVLFPLGGMREVALPGGDLVPGPGCNVETLARDRLTSDATGWRIQDIHNRRTSWKFFLPADQPVVLQYDDATLTLTTDAGWWGIWLNEGNFCNLLCIGVEPTNWPSDALADSQIRVASGAGVATSWEMTIA